MDDIKIIAMETILVNIYMNIYIILSLYLLAIGKSCALL